jgi:ubiquinone/menaquinone biosynthesis C-methylase UbiE
MLSHEEMVGLQAEKHDLIQLNNFCSRERYVLHLMHKFAYVQAGKLAKGKKVLDLGCNTGYGSKIISKTASSVVGVDVSKEAITAAQKRYRNSQEIRFKLIDGKQLPFDNNEFDMITSFQVIEHIVDHKIFIGELKRVLSSSGLAVFTTPNAVLRLDPGMRPWNEFHVREFNHSELVCLLKMFFSAIRIYGLCATEEVYAVEAERVRQSREKARQPLDSSSRCESRSLSQMSLDYTRSLIPAFIRTRLRRVRSTFRKQRSVVDAFMAQYGVEDFSYRVDNLEHALDLLAVCSDREDCIAKIQFAA